MIDKTKWLPEKLVSNKFLIITILLFPINLLVISSFQPRIFFAKESVWYLLSTNIFFLHGLMFCVLSLLVICKIGGLKLSDIGLKKHQVLTLLWLPIVVWLAEQLVILLLVPFGFAELKLNTIWLSPNETVRAVSSFVANTIGTGLNEETFFRGFIFTQLYAKFSKNPTDEKLNFKPFIYAALISSIIFALMHLQINPVSLLIFAFGGMIGCIIYARTKNLFIGIGLHGVFNSPMPLLQTDTGTAKLTVIFLMLLIVLVYPILTKKISKLTRKNLRQSTANGLQ